MKENTYIKVFEKLLDDSYHAKLLLFDALNESDKTITSKQTFKENLNISTFLLEKYLAQLNEEVTKIFGNAYFEENNQYIKLVPERNCNKKEILRFYLKKSTKVNMLKQLLLKEFTIISFSMDFYMSQSKVYKELQELKEILKLINVEVTNRLALVGSLEIVEMLMMDVYKVFDQKKETVYRQELMNLIKHHYQIEVSQSFIYYCETYLRTANYRCFNNENITRITYYHVSEDTAIIMDIRSLVEKYYPRLSKESTRKITNNMFIYFETQFNFQSSKIINKEILTLGVVYERFLVDKGFDLSIETLEKLTHDALKYQCLSLNILNDKRRMNSTKELMFFKKYYPAHYNIVLDFIEEYELNHQVSLSCYLAEKLLVSLIGHVDLYKLLPTYHICFDVRGSYVYNQVVKHYLSMQLLFPIEISWHVTNKTQLIITDHPELYSKTREMIIWNEPLNQSELKRLTEKISYYAHQDVQKK